MSHAQKADKDSMRKDKERRERKVYCYKKIEPDVIKRVKLTSELEALEDSSAYTFVNLKPIHEN